MLYTQEKLDSRLCLIVNADDFGLSRGINEGIIEGHKKGFITSASISANGEFFEDAVLSAKNNPGLDVGLHITLIEERPVSRPETVKSMLGANGLFFGKNYQFLFRYFLGKIKKNEIEKEIRAQFEKALTCGIRLTHVDSHRHIHMLPGILKIVIKLCREYNVYSLRFPYEPVISHNRCQGFLNNIYRRLIQLTINLFCLISTGIINKYDLKICAGCRGLLNSGNINLQVFKKIVNSLKGGRYEAVFHPALSDENLIIKYGHWNYNWAADMATLTSLRARDFLEDKGVKIISFSEVSANR